MAFFDDNADFRALGSELLAMAGASSDAFATAEAALEALSRTRYDVLMTDLSLPGMSGAALAQEAVRLHPGMRVILASGYGSRMPDLPGVQYAVLGKPFTFGELQEALGLAPLDAVK